MQYVSLGTTADRVEQPQQCEFHTTGRWLFSWKAAWRGSSNCRWSTGTAEQSSSQIHALWRDNQQLPEYQLPIASDLTFWKFQCFVTTHSGEGLYSHYCECLKRLLGTSEFPNRNGGMWGWKWLDDQVHRAMTRHMIVQKALENLSYALLFAPATKKPKTKQKTPPTNHHEQTQNIFIVQTPPQIRWGDIKMGYFSL